jgi:Flp pilus assembly pilin Flp
MMKNNKIQKTQSGSSMIEYMGLVLMVIVAVAAATTVFNLVKERFEAPAPTTTLPPNTTTLP